MNMVWNDSFEGTPAVSGSMRSRRVSIWKSLEPGDAVALSHGGFVYHRGTVDDRTADGQMIWVVDRIGDRRLFHIDDDFDLSEADHT